MEIIWIANVYLKIAYNICMASKMVHRSFVTVFPLQNTTTILYIKKIKTLSGNAETQKEEITG